MSLAFREAGPADGPVALLVHGFPQSSYMWRDVLPSGHLRDQAASAT